MKKICSFLTCALLLQGAISCFGQTPNSWVQKAYVGGSNGATALAVSAAFTIGNNTYVLSGGVVNGNSDDFWKYNAVTDTWTALADFTQGGGPRNGAIAFSIGSKGYYGFGNNGTYLNDFWEYDTLTGWSQVMPTGPVPPARSCGVGFSIGKKGFVGLGNDGSTMLADFWEWDQINNSWISRPPYPGGGRYIASCFATADKGYVGLGQDTPGALHDDFYQWDTTINNWLVMPNFPAGIRYGAASFSIGSKGYVGTGNNAGGGTIFRDFYEWDQVANAWTTTPVIAWLPTGKERFYATGFSVGGKGYVVGGGVTPGSAYNDLWMYTPQIPQAPSICMVTTDSASVNNVIYWDKTGFANADSFIVYREVSTNIYNRIGAVSYDSLSLFVDSNRAIGPANGDPNIGTYKYKLQLRDTFNVYSPLSKYHNSIMFNDPQTGFFTWNVYDVEGQTTPVLNFFLMRDSANIGDWRQVGAVSGTQTTLNDPTYATYQFIANWRVDASGFNCTPTARYGNNSMQGAIVKSRSNVKNNRTTGISQVAAGSLQVAVYPQPASDIISVDLGSIQTKITLELYNALGSLVHKETAQNTTRVNLNVQNLAAGVYTLVVGTEKGKVVKKLVKE